jgi:peptide-methionine (S)-S-oxide reductase
LSFSYANQGVISFRTQEAQTVIRSFAVSVFAAAALAAASAGAFAAPPTLESAVFAGGCFWTIEHDFELLPGVVKVTAGYTGGNEPHPTYDQVSGEKTGHVEAVQVTFNPAKIGYAQLTNRFWRMIDPTQADGQACDHGPSYQSAIFYASPEQRRIAEAAKAEIDQGVLKGRIVTQIRPATTFWPAERWHQHFATAESARYAAYRAGCGRDAVLKRIWGDDAEPAASERAGRR